jgi:hypothetical protein
VIDTDVQQSFPLSLEIGPGDIWPGRTFRKKTKT